MTDDGDASARRQDGPLRGGSDSAPSRRRLEDLLRASASIVERLDPEVVLRRIVEAGMNLVGARYGALGVIDPNGGLERFIHVGIDDRTVKSIGHLPTGRGVLGAVITDRSPIRLDHLAEDPRSAGFPAHHPAMESFLGVPVRVGDQVYGNLYLTEKADGPFSADDEELIIALAATAGIAIENARLYDVARTRELWNATIADVMAAMLDVTGENVLDVIAERMSALLGTSLVAVAVPQGADEFILTAVHGSEADHLRGRVFPAAGTLTARALATRMAVSVDGQQRAAQFDWQPGLGPTVAIPLFVRDEALGVLTVSRPQDGPAFTDADLDMAFSFAAQASIALEVVRGREDRRRFDTSRDRVRIARDLHDHVIQKLFGAGLTLQAISSTVDPETSDAIDTQVDAIDTAIRDIRTIIFALGSGDRRGAKGLRDRLLDVMSEVDDSLPTPPRVSFAGPLDSLITSALADDLAAVLREALTNVVKHAHAHEVDIMVAADEGRVELVVQDDGIGIPSSGRRSGLTNIAARAELHAGTCRITARPTGGTRIEWTVPIPLDPEAAT